MWFVGLTGVLLFSSCVPSLESKSAGQIGCSPEEIVISQEDQSSGILQQARTWVAECGGRRYMCTELTTMGATSEKTIAPTDSDVSCKDMDVADDAVRASDGSGAVGSPSASEEPEPSAEAPGGAAGFQFAMSRSDSEAACKAAGHEWSKIASRHYRCSGPVTGVGFEVSVALRYCDGQLCAITLIHRPERQWYASLGELRSALEGKYGAPTQEETALEFTCQRDGRFEQCLLHGAGRATITWAWSKDQRIELLAGKPAPHDDGEALPSLRIVYTRAAALLQVEPSAL